jgi:hypothetical protein
MKKNKQNSLLIMLWCMIIVCLIITLMFYIQFRENERLTDLINKNYSIMPSYESVNTFCKEKGFDYGWFTSYGCDRGINCNKQIGSLTENRCYK